MFLRLDFAARRFLCSSCHCRLFKFSLDKCRMAAQYLYLACAAASPLASDSSCLSMAPSLPPSSCVVAYPCAFLLNDAHFSALPTSLCLRLLLRKTNFCHTPDIQYTYLFKLSSTIAPLISDTEYRRQSPPRAGSKHQPRRRKATRSPSWTITTTSPSLLPHPLTNQGPSHCYSIVGQHCASHYTTPFGEMAPQLCELIRHYPIICSLVPHLTSRELFALARTSKENWAYIVGPYKAYYDNIRRRTRCEGPQKKPWPITIQGEHFSLEATRQPGAASHTNYSDDCLPCEGTFCDLCGCKVCKGCSCYPVYETIVLHLRNSIVEIFDHHRLLYSWRCRSCLYDYHPGFCRCLGHKTRDDGITNVCIRCFFLEAEISLQCLHPSHSESEGFHFVSPRVQVVLCGIH